jgi:hypothetical protein
MHFCSFFEELAACAVLPLGNSKSVCFCCRPKGYDKPDRSLKKYESFNMIVEIIVSEKSSSLRLKPGIIFGFLTFVAVNFLAETKLRSRHNSVMLSFRATRTAPTETRTQVTSPECLPSCILFLISGNKHIKFGADRLIPSVARNEYTYKYSQNFSFVYNLCIHMISIYDKLQQFIMFPVET